MEDILALCEVVSKQKIKHIEVLGQNHDPNKLTNKLYDAICSGSVKSEEDAIEFLYGDKKHKKKFQDVKRRLRKILINSMFFIDIHKYHKSDYEIALVKSYQALGVVKIMINRGHPKASIKVAEEALKLAIKYEIIHVILPVAKELRKRFGLFNYNKSKEENCNQIIKKYTELLIQENEAEEVYIMLSHAWLSKKGASEMALLPIQEKLNSLSKLQDSNTLYNFNLYVYFSRYLFAFFNKNYSNLLRISEEAIIFFKSKSGFSKFALFTFTQNLGLSHFINEDYEKALTVYRDALSLNPPKGKTNWYNILNQIFNTHLVLQNYTQAYDYLILAISEPKFSNLYFTLKEPWLVKEAYIQLLIKMGKVVEEKKPEKKLRPFRLKRFLNEVPHFSKDKRGLNIAILIIHILFLFIQKKESEIEDRFQSLNQYSFRYLRNDATLRSNLFIKMLLQLPKAAYHPVRTQRYAEKHHKRLLETPYKCASTKKYNPLSMGPDPLFTTH